MGTYTELHSEKYTEESEQLFSYDGTRLHLHSWQPVGVAPTRAAVIVHGLGGHAGYYADSLAPYLVPTGTAVYAPDLRGHGKSEGKRGDIESFTELERDVEATVRWVRSRHPDLPLYLIGESMGTPLAISHAANSVAELRPDFLVLVACVVAPTVQPRVDEIFRTVYYLATGPRKVALPITGREEKGVRDPEFVKVLKSDLLFNRKVSVRFLMSMTGTMNRAARLHARLNMPTLVLQGGRDAMVRHRATRAFFRRIAAADKEMHIFPEAFHAILNDPDSPEVRAKMLDWMERKHLDFNKGRLVG